MDSVLIRLFHHQAHHCAAGQVARGHLRKPEHLRHLDMITG
jgi:hypothetical protein